MTGFHQFQKKKTVMPFCPTLGSSLFSNKMRDGNFSRQPRPVGSGSSVCQPLCFGATEPLRQYLLRGGLFTTAAGAAGAAVLTLQPVPMAERYLDCQRGPKMKKERKAVSCHQDGHKSDPSQSRPQPLGRQSFPLLDNLRSG